MSQDLSSTLRRWKSSSAASVILSRKASHAFSSLSADKLDRGTPDPTCTACTPPPYFCPPPVEFRSAGPWHLG
eukprot:5107784-Amphidinium_carterae.1